MRDHDPNYARDEGLFLEALVPALARRGVAGDPPSLLVPSATRFPAAVLLADLSEFSSLAERFSRRGRRGAEDLKDLLNLVFGGLVDLVTAHGGQVFKFPGDAVLALWPAADVDESTAVRRACQCALATQEILD